MALEDPQAEPSMEEILASIRRIISEEEEAPTAEPVLDLTQAEPVARAAQTVDDVVFDAVEPPLAARPARPARAPAVEPMEVTILSSPTANAAAGALARLTGQLRVADTPSLTVEGMVRELLKPMLKEWLEHNLPTIVEGKVEAELDRIARLAR